MSCSENDGDTLMLSKEQPDSSSADEGSCSGSSARGGRAVLKKGPWTTAEDALLIRYVQKHGEGNWNAVQKRSGLCRCGKSCRLRWANHLRPHLKKGAFTPEEEQFIIQMHSKMGNRWARMAALLPGRTDNEIKNYWNTRIKRRQRAGLPLYPPKVSLQTSNENQVIQITSEFSSGNQQNSGVLQRTTHEMLEFRFDPCKANPGPLPCAPPLPDVPVTDMPFYGFGSYTLSFLNLGANPVNRARESETSFPGYHLSLTGVVPSFEQLPSLTTETGHLNPVLGCPYDPDPKSKNLASFSCSVSGNPALTNGNFSSSRPPPGTVKMELPSLQYPEADYVDRNTSSSFTSSYDVVDAYIQSPENTSVQSDCASPRNNGLLEDLVQESQAISSGKKQSGEESFNHSVTPINMTESSTAKWEDTSDPNSPFCLSAVSIFNVCNPIINSTFDGVSPYEAPMDSEATMLSVEQVSTLCMPDKGSPNLQDFLRPDVLLGSGWLVGNFLGSVDAIAAPLGEEENAHGPAGISSMVSLESYPWTTMPPVHQISEH